MPVHHHGVYGAYTHERCEQPEPTVMRAPFFSQCQYPLTMLIAHVDDVVPLEVQGCHLGSRNMPIGRISIRIDPSLYVRMTRVGSGRACTARHDEEQALVTGIEETPDGPSLYLLWVGESKMDLVSHRCE